MRKCMICYNCGWQKPAGWSICEKCGEILKNDQSTEDIYEENEGAENILEDISSGAENREGSKTGDRQEQWIAGDVKDKADDQSHNFDFLCESELFYNKYLLRKLLSNGVSSQVWMAADMDTDQEVALKVITSPFREECGRLKEEFLLLRSFSHRHIVHPDFFGIYKDLPFYVMPYYAGGDASQYVGNVKETTIRQFLGDVAQGLACFHARGIVHGDVKPEHVLIDGEGRFVLCGFGCSRGRDERTFTHKDSQMETDYNHRAPEAFNSHPILDTRSDIWALGISLQQMIIGKLPFNRIGILEQSEWELKFFALLSSPEQKEYRDRRNRLKELDDWLYFKHICERCLDENPLSRITANELCFWVGLKIEYSEQLRKYGIVTSDGSLVADYIYDKIDYFGYRCIPNLGQGPQVPAEPHFLGAYFERGIYRGYLKYEGMAVYERDVCTEWEYKRKSRFSRYLT